MLGSIDIVALVPTTDAVKARAFYEGVLGLGFVKDDGFALVLDANGIMVRVAKVPGTFIPAQFTILGWKVTGIEQIAAQLQKKVCSSSDLGSSSRTNFASGPRRPATK